MSNEWLLAVKAVYNLPLCIPLLTGHGSRDLGVDQPVTTLDIVVITSRANAFNQEGPDALDGGKLANRHNGQQKSRVGGTRLYQLQSQQSSHTTNQSVVGEVIEERLRGCKSWWCGGERGEYH